MLAAGMRVGRFDRFLIGGHSEFPTRKSFSAHSHPNLLTRHQTAPQKLAFRAVSLAALPISEQSQDGGIRYRQARAP
jgi:hypothetical protein